MTNLTLLSKDDFLKYEPIIPVINAWWWLKTSCFKNECCVYAVDNFGILNYDNCSYRSGGVRPVCIFNFELSDSLFWCKPEKLIGSKIEYGKYKWTILGVEPGKLHTLCDEVVALHCFDPKTDIWEDSELKQWLEIYGIKRITT